MVIVSFCCRPLNERHETLDIVREDRPQLCLRRYEERRIRQRPEIVALVDRLDVVRAGAELLGDGGRVVLVEKEPQEKSSWLRRQELSARSASSRASAIHASISSWNSA